MYVCHSFEIYSNCVYNKKNPKGAADDLNGRADGRCDVKSGVDGITAKEDVKCVADG